MKFTAIETDIVRRFQNGALDDNGQRPERAVSDGTGNPCRHCLTDIPAGAQMLVLAHRPFPQPQPYAETGPIFLCADPCSRGGGNALPDILRTSPDYLIRGYDKHNRIVYGSGAVVEAESLPKHAQHLFEDRSIAYIHVRSARNNCYQLRIDR